MSTISEALRKAQRQRLSVAPEAGGEPAGPIHGPPPAHRQKPSRAAALVAWGVALILAALFLAWYLPPAVTGTHAPASPPAAKAPPREDASAASAAPAGSLPAPSVPAAVATPQPAPIAVPAAPPRVEGTGPRAESPPVETTAAAPAVPKPSLSPSDAPALTGIFYSDVNPMAILGGETLREGETVGRYRLVKIAPDSVTVAAGDDSFVIRMKR